MRRATEQINFRLTAEQRQQMEKRAEEMGIHNLSAYIRKMALNGLCLQLDVEEIHQITTLLSRTSANLNQYAKRANATGSIYAEDIQDLQKSMEELLALHKQLMDQLAILKFVESRGMLQV